MADTGTGVTQGPHAPVSCTRALLRVHLAHTASILRIRELGGDHSFQLAVV